MGKQILTQLDFDILPALENPGAGFIAIGAKLDGLYIKIQEQIALRIATINDLITKADASEIITLQKQIDDLKKLAINDIVIDSHGRLIINLYDGSSYSAGRIRGNDGRGIIDTSYDSSTGILTFLFSDGTTYQTTDIRGEGGSGSNNGYWVLEVNDLAELDDLDLEEGIYIIKGGVKGHLTVINDTLVQSKFTNTQEWTTFVCRKEYIQDGKTQISILVSYAFSIDNVRISAKASHAVTSNLTIDCVMVFIRNNKYPVVAPVQTLTFSYGSVNSNEILYAKEGKELDYLAQTTETLSITEDNHSEYTTSSTKFLEENPLDGITPKISLNFENPIAQDSTGNITTLEYFVYPWIGNAITEGNVNGLIGKGFASEGGWLRTNNSSDLGKLLISSNFDGINTFSFNFWVKAVTSTASAIIVHRTYDIAGTYYRLDTSDEHFNFQAALKNGSNMIHKDESNAWKSVINNGSWNMVTFTYSGTASNPSTQLYLNGQLLSSVVHGSGSYLSELNFGEFIVCPSFNLSDQDYNLDLFTMFKVQLTAKQIEYLYNNGSGRVI